MDVPLSLLPDRVVVDSLSTLRCARVGVGRRSRLKVLTADGQDCPYSHELVCRRMRAPVVGSTIVVAGFVGVVSAVVQMDTPGPWMRHARVYVTTRVDVTGVLPTAVVLYPSVESVDGYGTPVRSPSTGGLVVRARIEPASSTESEADGQRRAQTWTLTTDGDLIGMGGDAYATVEDPDGVTYALVGDPLVRTDPTGAEWSTAVMRRIGPGYSDGPPS